MRRWWLALSTLAVIALADLVPAVRACTVCYGEAQGPTIEAAKIGVWVIFGMTICVQGGFAWFFVSLRRRAKALSGQSIKGEK